MEHAECTINLRRHAGTYEDSMATSIAIQATMPALIEAMQITLSLIHIKVTEDIVSIDPLIDGSGESGVFITGYGVYGVIDGPLRTSKDKPRSLLIPRICGNCGTDDRNQSGRCNRCTGAQVRAWKLVNPELAKEKSNAWKKANKSRVEEYRRKWNAANKENNDVVGKAWRDANPGKLRANAKRFLEKNPESGRLAASKYYARNKERIAAERKAAKGVQLGIIKAGRRRPHHQSGGVEGNAKASRHYAKAESWYQAQSALMMVNS